jgi:hypothetical protein
MQDQPILLPRSLWQYLVNVMRADQTTAERILACAVIERDYDTNGFLTLRYKLLQGILRGLDDEAVQKLTQDKPAESEVEIHLTCGELTYLDMNLDLTAFQGAAKVKQALWKALEDAIEAKRT